MPVVRVILREGQESVLRGPRPRFIPRIARYRLPAIKTVSRNFNRSITSTGNMSRRPVRARAKTPKPIRR